MSTMQPLACQKAKASRILVADDDPIIRSILVSKLSTLTSQSVEIVEAEDGHRAWQQLINGDFQLALVDLEMPNVDGFALIQCMRSHPNTKHIPVIVVTSRDDPQALRNALEAGASSYLTKPIYWSMFNTHIEHLLRLSESSIENTEALERAKSEATELKAAFAALQKNLTTRLARLSHIANDATADFIPPSTPDDLKKNLLTLAREIEILRLEIEQLNRLPERPSAWQEPQSQNTPEQLHTHALRASVNR
ncbi:MAG: response regulator [Hyphomicrobium sp.]